VKSHDMKDVRNVLAPLQHWYIMLFAVAHLSLLLIVKIFWTGGGVNGTNRWECVDGLHVVYFLQQQLVFPAPQQCSQFHHKHIRGWHVMLMENCRKWRCGGKALFDDDSATFRRIIMVDVRGAQRLRTEIT